MYVSLDTVFAEPIYSTILGNITREDAFIDYCVTRGVNAVSFYDLHRVIEAKTAALKAFIVRLRRIGGIRWVEAIAAEALFAWDQVAVYQANCASADEMFDGIVTEIEYWAGGGTDVNVMLDPVRYMKTKNPLPRPNPLGPTAPRRFYYASYIGWPQAGQIATDMAGVLDHLYVHCYRTNPTSAWPYVQTRVEEMLSGANMTAVIIYSAEGTRWAAGTEHFMGDWLAASVNNTVQSAEEYFEAAYDVAKPNAANAARIWGFQWFTYYYAAVHDNATVSRGAYPRPPSALPSWPLVRRGSEWQNIAWCGDYQGANTRCQSTTLVEMKHDVVFVDLFDTDAAAIAALKPRNWTNGTSVASLPDRQVICYYSAGTWENWRPDIANFSSFAKRGPMGGWPGEQWLDIFNETVMALEVRPAMQWRLELAAAKGCDGVEPDNVDCWQNSDCRLTGTTTAGKVAQLAYNRWTADAAHALGLAVGLKNDLEQIPLLVDLYDFAVNENCQQYNECALLLPFLRQDKAVFRTEYTVTLAAACAADATVAYGAYFSTLRAVNGYWLDCASLSTTTTTTTATTSTTAVATTATSPSAVPTATTTTAAPTTTTTTVPTSGRRRGLYVNIYEAHSDERHSLILDSAWKEDLLLRYAQAHGFNALSLYDLATALPANAVALRNFIRKARMSYGITHVEAIGTRTLAEWDQIKYFQANTTDPDSRFDGALTEIEYWHSGNVTWITSVIDYARSQLGIPGRGSRPFRYAAYIGAPAIADYPKLAEKVDTLFVHCYVTDPALGYSFSAPRFSRIFPMTTLEVITIFSAEGVRYNSFEPYMGDWLNQTGHTFAAAEDIFQSNFSASPHGAANGTRHVGYQWFTYYLASTYRNDSATQTGSTTTTTTAAITTTTTTTTTSSSTTTVSTTATTAMTTGGSNATTGTATATAATNGTTATPTTLNSTTAPPASTTMTTTATTAAPPAASVMLRAVIRIGGTHFAIFLGNATRTQRMRAVLLMDLVRILRVAASRITIDRLTLGSLIVELSVSREDATSTTTPPSPTAAASPTAAELEAAITGVAATSSAAWLVNTSQYYRDEYVAVTPGGNATVDSLTVLSASSTIVSVPSPTGTASGNTADGSDGCGGQCVVFYAGIALALVLLAGALVAFVVFLHRRRGGRAGAEKPADGHDQSPPTINWEDGGDDGYDHGNRMGSSDWVRRSGAGWAPTHPSKQATRHPYGGQPAASGGRRY